MTVTALESLVLHDKSQIYYQQYVNSDTQRISELKNNINRESKLQPRSSDMKTLRQDYDETTTKRSSADHPNLRKESQSVVILTS